MTLRHLLSRGISTRMGRLKKRSVNLAGHATSLALEPEFWSALEAAASHSKLSLAALIQTIDSGRAERPLASACRVFALLSAQAQPGLPGNNGGMG